MARDGSGWLGMARVGWDGSGWLGMGVTAVRYMVSGAPPARKCKNGGQEYRVYFPIDSQDVRIWGPWNDPSVCFRKAHLANIKASPAEVRQAQQAAAAEWPDSD